MTDDKSTYDYEQLISQYLEDSETQALILVFTATWISQSSIVEIVVEKVKEATPSSNVICFDADLHEDFFIKYKVQTLPTVIIIKRHKLIAKIKGTFSKKQVLDLL